MRIMCTDGSHKQNRTFCSKVHSHSLYKWAGSKAEAPDWFAHLLPSLQSWHSMSLTAESLCWWLLRCLASSKRLTQICAVGLTVFSPSPALGMLRFYHNLALLNIHWKTTKDKKCRSLHYSFGKNVLANTLTSLLLTSNMPPKNCYVLAFILLSHC